MKTIKRILKWFVIGVPVILLLWGFIAYWTSTNDCGRIAATPGNSMKAIVFCDYGGPEVLKFEDVPKPAPNDDQILVKIRAAAVNPIDWHYVRGIPYVARAMAMGMRKPKDTRLGADYSGIVEAVGKNVTQFKPGDEVFGGKSGTLAEYLCARADRAVVLKPANITFEQAGGVAVAAVTALQGLRDKGKVQPGEQVLINGASGGVGTFAVQIAKWLGANVTGVCSSRNVEMVRSLGADQVVDYTREDFTTKGNKYDVILDNVGVTHSLSQMRRALTPKGRYVLVGGGGPNDGNWIGPMARPVKAFLMTPFISQRMGFFVANLNRNDMQILADLMESGHVTPVIDRTYKLSETQAALAYLEQGRARGKVIITPD
ncbi:MAG TPA: NAD(P)-dependent alcohol dehydrogenase [Chthoniobacterales bacterium]|nr:NAD(P)-dependent alcohol dehydrogenase [Chthoniobacterales bacterium]